MGKKMKNAPVYYALAAVRFNTLAFLDQYVPALQDQLRKAGYPDFDKAVITQFAIVPGAAPNNQNIRGKPSKSACSPRAS